MLIYENNKYIWKGKYESKLPKAGFYWHPASKTWWTASPYVASLLYEEADSNTQTKLKHIQDRIFFSHLKDNCLAKDIIPAPKDLVYMPFQVAGINHLAQSIKLYNTALLADEQGLGKTVQAIGVANFFKFEKILVICPASLRLNWTRELERWHIHNPGARAILTGKDKLNSCGSNVLSYNMADKAGDYKPDYIIVDEAHMLKNINTKRTKIILGEKGVISRAPSIILTGTPFPNGKPHELYPVLSRCVPRCIDNLKYWPFVKKFCRTENSEYGFRVLGAKKERLEELSVRLRGSGFMTRRLKKAVLEQLPPKQYKMVIFPPTGKMKKILEKETEFDASEILKHGVPVTQGLPELRRQMGIAKIPVVIDYVNNLLESGVKKAIVFAHHKEVISYLVEGLQKYNPIKITGSTPVKLRQEYVDRFQQDPNTRLAIGNIQAMGMGITLTAASDVVFAEGSWVPGENEQCADRAHRIGQENNVLLHFLVVAGSLDAHILGSAARKKRDIKNLLN